MIFGDLGRIRSGVAILAGTNAGGALRLLLVGVLGKLTERLQTTGQQQVAA
jgi:hypothetical protein